MLKRLLLVIALFTVPTFTLVSCARSTSTTPAPPKTSIQQVATALDKVATIIGDLQTVIINANMQGLINDQVTGDILRITVKIAQAGKEANKVAAAINQVSPNDKTKILSILNPVVQSVKDALSTGLLPIKDPTLQNTIGVALTSVQATLTTVQLLLGGQ